MLSVKRAEFWGEIEGESRYLCGVGLEMEEKKKKWFVACMSEVGELF